jgi:SAM-dependent MidA family methyltransferase
MQASLHGTDADPGYYRRGSGPGRDFRTASTVAPDVLSTAIATLFARLPSALARSVVEIGAGTGQLLGALAERLPEEATLVGVDQRDRPSDLPSRVQWERTVPRNVSGLLLAVEWLDTVPVDVVVGARCVTVDADGTERLGPEPSRRDREWLARWWPRGSRREVGVRRDDAWAEAVGALRAGIAVAIDYGHLASDRPESGSLTAYRSGRAAGAVPDGCRDITAAVAWDACAVAGRRAAHSRGVTSAVRLTTQRAALRELGVRAELPGRPGGGADAGQEYLAGLERAGRAGRLLDPAGLGGFGWLLHAVGVPAELLPAGQLLAGPEVGPEAAAGRSSNT